MERNFTTAQDVLGTVRLDAIIPGKNPRTHFDPQKQSELEESIKEKGIIQPVRLRPVGDKFEIVAGERRVRAALTVYGTSWEIPAIIKELSDDEAEEMALVENTLRDDMSVTEEAKAAGKILSRCKGDREETARILAWPMPKLARRLALLELTDEVMTSLDERTISTGHAELLATVSKEKQNPALQKIVDLKLSVQFCRDNLLQKATKFEGAIFDTADCASCRFNSETQASLFTENIGKGYCTNSDCFEKKNAEKLEGVKTELLEEFPTVRIIGAGDHASFSTLEAEGNLGVGNEQYSACKSCGDFGATISGLVNDLGKISKSVCFNQTCQQKKVADRIKAEQNRNTPPLEKQKPAIEKKATKPSASEVSAKVKEYRRTIWNSVAKREFAQQPDKSRAFVFSLGASGDLHHVDRSKLKEIYQKIAEAPYPDTQQEALLAVSALPPEKQNKLASALAVATVDKLTENQVKTAGQFLNADLASYWQINSEYLALLTKSEIESVVAEVGLDAAMGENFKKTLGGKKDELIKTILGAPFAWKGAIPKMMVW